MHLASQYTIYRSHLASQITIYRRHLASQITIYRKHLASQITIYRSHLASQITIYRSDLPSQNTIYRSHLLAFSVSNHYSAAIYRLKSLFILPHGFSSSAVSWSSPEIIHMIQLNRFASAVNSVLRR
jgi:hypothetical protein